MCIRKTWLGLAVLLNVVCVPIPVFAQLIEEGLVIQGGLGDLNASHLANNRVYVATCGKVMLAVYDFSGTPTLLGKINYPGNSQRYATALLVDGNYAYVYYTTDVFGGQGRLAVVNVTNPTSPVLSGELPLANSVRASMAKSGNFLYIFNDNSFTVVNVSNPASPTLIRNVSAEVFAGTVVANRLYTAGNDGVGVYDISQPDNPTLIGTVFVGEVEKIASANQRLFVINSSSSELLILDLANPNMPAVVGSHPTEYTEGLAVLGNLAILSVRGLGTEVVDVSNPAAPTTVRRLSNHLVSNADPISGRVLIQGGSLLILYNPATNQSVSLEAPYPLRSVQSDQIVFALNEQSLAAYDISNPSAPSPRGKTSLPYQSDIESDLALISNNHLALSTSSVLLILHHTGNSFRELARIGSPRARHPDEPPTQYRLRSSRNILAFYSDNGQIKLYDVLNPESPVLRGTVSEVTHLFDLAGSFLYSTDDDYSSLVVYDLSDPSFPTRVGGLVLSEGHILDVAAGAGYVLLAQPSNLLLVDVRTPNAPRIVSQYPVSGIVFPRVVFDAAGAMFYAYDGFYIYGSRKVVMFRVSDFPNLVPAATITLNRPVWSLAPYSSKVIGAGGSEGLIIYRNTLVGGVGLNVTGITPSQGANRGALSVRIFGTGFESGISVRLERGGEQITARDVQLVSSTELRATFEFSGQPENTQWDVVVRTADGREERLASGFTLIEAPPVITELHPNITLPLSSTTLTIVGAHFHPDAQVVLLPPHGTSISPITASRVEYLSHERLRAIFDLSPYQQIEIDALLHARVQVRNPNNRHSNTVDLRINAPTLLIETIPTVGMPPEAATLTVELEVSNSIATEPIQISLIAQIGEAVRRIDATQVESLGERRWRAVFPADDLTPDNLAQRWAVDVRQLGGRAVGHITVYRAYRAKLVQLVSVPNTVSEASIQLDITNDSPSLSIRLRQGDRTITPIEVRRNQNVPLPGVTRLTLRCPIRLQDLGEWDAEVRFDESRTVHLPSVLRVQKGSLVINAFEWTQPFTIFGTLRAHLRITPVPENLEQLQVVIRVPQRVAVERTELTSTRVQPSNDGSQLVVEFAGVKAALTADAYPDIEVRHPLLNSARTSANQPIQVGALQANVHLWIPVGYRAGRVIRIATIYLHNRGSLPETPYLELPIPVRENILQSGQFRAEYKVVRSDGIVVAAGSLPLTPNNHTIRTKLRPVLPNQQQIYVVTVRFVPTGRNAPDELSTRIVPPAASVVVFGLSVLLPYVAYHYSPHVSCSFDYVAEQVHNRISTELEASLDPVNWDKIPELEDIRNFLFLFHESDSEQGFISALLSKMTTDFIAGLPREAAEAWLTQRITEELENWGLRGELARNIARKAAAVRTTLASLLVDFALGNLSYDDLIIEMMQLFIPHRIPLQVAQSALGLMFDRSRECLERIDYLSRAYMHRLTFSQRADVGFSYDPNEKNGAGGIDGYIRSDENIFYEIKFENLPTATAGAEEVLIEDVLPDGLDLDSIEFVSVQVGTIERRLPEGTTNLSVDIDMHPERPVVVQVRSELDKNTRTLRVTYKGIDPDTGDYYEEGFLPPNQNPPHGEGSVVFRIRPLSDAPSGTQFVNRATIIFDPHLGINAPIVTNAHSLTLDKQPPSVVVRIPANRVPEVKAQLQWQATDDASGVEDVEIWTQTGEGVQRVGQTRASGERTDSGSVQIRARRFGDEMRILTRSRDRVGNLAPLSEEPVAVIRMGQAPQFSAGLHLLGLPLQPDPVDLQPIFGFQNNHWATYNPSTGQYVQYPDTGSAPAIGRGFWTVLPNPVQPDLIGTLPDPDREFSINLQSGWNLIANPWTEPLVWHRDAVQVRHQGVTRPLGRATELVEPYLWGWEPDSTNPQQGRYVLISDAQILPGMQTVLQPWRGYWIFARQSCTLVLPTPEQAALFAGLTRSYEIGRSGGWSFRIAAHLGNSYDEVLLGVSGNEQGLQIGVPPNPPVRSAIPGVQLRLLRDDASLEAEIHPRSRRAPTWTLELQVPPSEEDRIRTILITTPDLARLPRGVNPVLRDLQTGERRFLRNGAGWQIPVPREGLTRSYEISLVNTSRLLRISGLSVLTNRGTNQHTIQFTLSDEAQVKIMVLAGGQVMRTLQQDRSRSPGLQQAFWDGRDAQGRALPPGHYQILVQAQTEDGQIVRASTPLILTR